MGACARNMWSDPAEIKPAQCCIKLVFHLTYTMMHGSTKLKFSIVITLFLYALPTTKNINNLSTVALSTGIHRNVKLPPVYAMHA